MTLEEYVEQEWPGMAGDLKAVWTNLQRFNPNLPKDVTIPMKVLDDRAKELKMRQLRSLRQHHELMENHINKPLTPEQLEWQEYQEKLKEEARHDPNWNHGDRFL